MTVDELVGVPDELILAVVEYKGSWCDQLLQIPPTCELLASRELNLVELALRCCIFSAGEHLRLDYWMNVR